MTEAKQENNDLDPELPVALVEEAEDADAIEPHEVEETKEIDFDELPDLFREPEQALEAGPSRSTDLVRYDPLQRYLSEIRHIPTLSREEEQALAVRYQTHGDTVAGYKLVLANLRLVVIIAREYQRNVQNIMDLIQEGNIGLLEAVKKFDPFRGIRFPSYAMYWVRAYILRYLISNVRLVKIGTTQAQRKLFFNLVKEKERLEREGFVPEAKLLAQRLNVKVAEVLEMEQRLALPDLSVDAPTNREEGTGDLHGVIPDNSETAEEAVTRGEFSKKLRSAVEEFKKGVDEKERAIIERRLFTEEPVTLQVIADQFGVTRERIRQIESRLKNRLKEYLSNTLDLGPDGEVIISKKVK
jgi:RNA polymerase sigma-32 factor